MKSVKMHADHNQPMTATATRHYIAGRTYHNVLEEHARAIVKAGTGEVIPTPADAGDAADKGGKNADTSAKAGSRQRRG